jgi:anti-sigma-K factor RskA
MNNASHITQDDLYLFALQLLPDADMKSAAQHLKECPLCRLQVGEIQGDLVTYAMTAEMQAPPSQARERLLHQVAAEKKVIPIDRVEQQLEPVLYPRNSRMFQMEAPEERERRRVAPFMAWTGWAVAATVAVVASMQFEQRKVVEQNLAAETAQLDKTTQQTAQAKELMQALTNANAMQVSLHVPLTAHQQPKLDPEGHATYVAGQGSLVFVASHLDPLQPAKTYELWLLPEEAGLAPIPAGLFKPDANGNATVVMPQLPKGVAAKGFGVTVEDEGGSKTPTAPIVLAGM